MYGYDVFHEDILTRLINSVRQGTNAATYIFEGPAGLRKNEAALLFAKVLVCENQASAPCCSCPACLEAQGGNHPDIIYVYPEKDKKTIGVIENDAEYSAAGRCLMSYIPKDSAIKEGDMVLTSGSSVFPADILIGTVTSVFPDPNGLTKHAVIQPAEDVYKVTNVFVITGFEGQDE